MIRVKKKSGDMVEYVQSKIVEMVNWACAGLDVDSPKLLLAFNEHIFDGVTTASIQRNLVHSAKSLAKASEPDWVKVAGKLHATTMWASRKSYDVPFIDLYEKLVDNGEWAHPNFKLYTQAQLLEAGSWIDQSKDLNHSYTSLVMFEQKYLSPNECVQHLHLGNALLIASIEPEVTRMAFAKQVYDALSGRKVSLASPWLSNLRKNLNIASCFTMTILDDLDSIYKALSDYAKISKAGGGCGVFLGACRAKGSKLMGRDGKAGGITGWVKLFNDTAVYVNQGGYRKGAVTVALPVWHNDIIDFLNIQKEVGDLRDKSFDIQPQITFHDAFWVAEENDGYWYTFCPHEVESVIGEPIVNQYNADFERVYAKAIAAAESGRLKVFTKHKAKNLFKEFLKTVIETGLPYAANIDTINAENPNKHAGCIVCVNLCCESFSNTFAHKEVHTCNLASLVVGRIEVDELAGYAALTTHILDNGIELTLSPIPESAYHNQKYRTIGVGVQGYADLVAREWKSYLDKDFAKGVFERIAFGCTSKSIELAKERGTFGAYVGSTWETGEQFDKYASRSILGLDWVGLKAAAQQYGVRNSQMMSPAPNTSTSMAMDAGAGIQPPYSGFMVEDNSVGKLPVVGMFLKENPLAYSRTQGGYDQSKLTEVVGAMQQFTDTGISAEYVADMNLRDIKVSDYANVYRMAWKNKTKAVYYYRTIKKGGTKDVDESCAACAG